MELWFIYALASVAIVGINAFILKISAENNYSSAFVTTWSTAISCVLALAVSFLFFDFEGAWNLGIILGISTGIIFTIGTILRIDALKYIDTAIFYPLYKAIGPLLTLFAGIIFFSEQFNTLEWLGIVMGITVPLLLLHREEEVRQKNLKLGLLLMLGAGIFTAASAAIAKVGAETFSNVFLFIAVSHLFGAISSGGIYQWQKYTSKSTQTPYSGKHITILVILAGITQFLGFATMLLAFTAGGSLAIVYTIGSFYILIPIILSIWWYKEHFNLRKGAAIALSILALAFLR